MMEKRIQIPPKAGHHRPTSETPFSIISLRAGPMVAQVLHASLVALRFFRGSDSVLLRIPVALRFVKGVDPDPCPPPPPL